MGTSVDSRAAEIFGRASDDEKYCFALVRYMPSPVRGEFVNIGVVLRESFGEKQTTVRFTRDWHPVLALDPQADVALLREVGRELEETLPASEELLSDLRSWANMLQITEFKARVATGQENHMADLMSRYVERAYSWEEGPAVARERLRGQMQEHFQRRGLWSFMQQSVPAAKYTRPGDPLILDYLARSTQVARAFQAVSMKDSADSALVLAQRVPDLMDGFKKADGRDLEVMVIVEPGEQLGHDSQARDSYNFALSEMGRSSITVMTTLDLPAMCLDALAEFSSDVAQ